jgi:hypothetical protein
MGAISYTIYLRANALYSFANQEANQITYNLTPYDGEKEEFYYNGEPLMYNGTGEKGAYFSDTYATFMDAFVLDSKKDGIYVANNA